MPVNKRQIISGLKAIKSAAHLAWTSPETAEKTFTLIENTAAALIHAIGRTYQTHEERIASLPRCPHCGVIATGMNANSEECLRNPDRDPRIYPQPGDQLRDASGQVIVVRPLARGEFRDLTIWRKQMKDAEIISRAKGD